MASSRNKELPRGIPLAVIKRLPVYHTCLVNLCRSGIDRVSSSTLAEMAGVTASQLRQDLNYFGSFGQQGYGYKVPLLLREIEKILGIDREFHVVVVGVGNLGRAILGYRNFRRRGFVFDGAFDADERLVGTEVAEVPVRHVSELAAFLSVHPVDIGVIATPEEAAQGIADIMVGAGIKGILNFASMRISVPERVVLENVNLSTALMSLACRACHTSSRGQPVVRLPQAEPQKREKHR